MSIWQETWKDALDLSIKMVKSYPMILLGTFLCGFFLNSFIESPFNASPSSASDQWRIASSMLSAFWDLTSNMILFILSTLIPIGHHLLKGQKEVRWNWETFVSLASESLRVLGRVLLWSLLLLIPGFIQYVRLSFVPYIVAFSKKYDDGSLNALEASNKLTQPLLIPLIGLTLIMGILMIGLEFIPQIYLEFHAAPIRFMFELTAFGIGIYGFCLVRILFHKTALQNMGAI